MKLTVISTLTLALLALANGCSSAPQPEHDNQLLGDGIDGGTITLPSPIPLTPADSQILYDAMIAAGVPNSAQGVGAAVYYADLVQCARLHTILGMPTSCEFVTVSALHRTANGFDAYGVLVGAGGEIDQSQIGYSTVKVDNLTCSMVTYPGAQPSCSLLPPQ